MRNSDRSVIGARDSMILESDRIDVGDLAVARHRGDGAGDFSLGDELVQKRRGLLQPVGIEPNGFR